MYLHKRREMLKDGTVWDFSTVKSIAPSTLQSSRYGDRSASVNEIPDLLDKHRGDFCFNRLYSDWHHREWYNYKHFHCRAANSAIVFHYQLGLFSDLL